MKVQRFLFASFIKGGSKKFKPALGNQTLPDESKQEAFSLISRLASAPESKELMQSLIACFGRQSSIDTKTQVFVINKLAKDPAYQDMNK